MLSHNSKNALKIKNTKQQITYRANEKQLKAMEKGRLLNPNGKYKGYFRVKFVEDKYILDKAREYVNDANLVFSGKDMYNYLISLKEPYITERLTHNNIQGILLKIGCRPIKHKNQTRGLWTNKKKIISILKFEYRDFLMEKYNLSKLQSRMLVNFMRSEENE
ncbi:MAG: hypothetical protein PHU05_04945 [Bacilli bacterium]|nr:hypothetical protein [Bacilli bacterium]